MKPEKLLKRTSAIVYSILAYTLPSNIKYPLINQYLILRAFDEIEDSDLELEVKRNLLNNFVEGFKKEDYSKFENAIIEMPRRTNLEKEELIYLNFEEVFDYFKQQNDKIKTFALDNLIEMKGYKNFLTNLFLLLMI